MKPIKHISVASFILFLIVFFISSLIGSRLSELISSQSQLAGTVEPPTGCTYVINSGQALNTYSSIATAGQTVCVRAGTYNATLRPVTSGQAGALITYKAYPGEGCQGALGEPKTTDSCQVVIDGQNIRSTGVDLSSRNYVQVEGFEITRFRDQGVYSGSWGGAGSAVQGIEIINNYIHENGVDLINGESSKRAVEVGCTRTLRIENNEIWRNSGTGIQTGCQVEALANNILIRGNNIHYNGKDGIRGGLKDSVIEFNKIYDQFHTDHHPDGLDLSNSQINVVIRYNTIYDSTQLIYFPLKDEPNLTARNIEIYGNRLYTDRYASVAGGEAPGIFFDATCGTSVVDNISIHSNTFGWVGYGAIWIDDAENGSGCAGSGQLSNIKIFNNIFYQSDIEVGTVDNNSYVADYNLFFQAGSNRAEGSHSLMNADPQFVDYRRHQAWDFRLQPTSPALDQGALGVIVVPAGFTDWLSTSRPQDGPDADTILQLDIGGFELLGNTVGGYPVQPSAPCPTPARAGRSSGGLPGTSLDSPCETF